MLCHIILYYVILYYIVFHSSIYYYSIFCYILLYDISQVCFIFYMSYSVASYGTILYDSIKYFAT